MERKGDEKMNINSPSSNEEKEMEQLRKSCLALLETIPDEKWERSMFDWLGEDYFVDLIKNQLNSFDKELLTDTLETFKAYQ